MKNNKKGKAYRSCSVEESKKERKKRMYAEPRGVALQPAQFAYPCEPSLHAISTTILPRLGPFVLRSVERPPSSLSFEMHRCVRSLHNYYDYRE